MTASLDAIVAGLEGRREGRGYRCLCPIPGHAGHHFTTTPGKDGKPLVYCQQGGTQQESIDALKELSLWPTSPNGTNLHLNGARRQAVSPGAYSKPEAEYAYIDPETLDLLATKKRYPTVDEKTGEPDKTFLWFLPGADKPGLGGLKESELPLYNAHLVGATEGPVIIVEGEKAATACLDAGQLAISPNGGAAQKDFGNALKVLTGRDVVPWPDNDQPGRALMRRIADGLEGIAASITFVSPSDMPPKGDAHDYFAAGGTKDALFAELVNSASSPRIEETPTGYLVTLPESGGLVRFRFDDLEHRSHTLDAEVTAWQEIPGVSAEPFTARLNLLSLSNREAYRRQLDEMMLEQKKRWTLLLNRACQMVRKAHEEADPSYPILDAPTEAMRPALLQPIITTGATVIFGKGGSGKTFLALGMALAIATGGEFLGRTARQVNVLYVDYEADGATLKDRIRMLCRGRGDDITPDVPIFYWPARGVPLADMIPALQRKIREAHIGLIVVDSVALAAGAEPEKSDTAIRYFNALAKLDCNSLNVAHVTKGDEDQWPFGSIFWHNNARSTWNVKLLQDQEAGVAQVGMFHRKANNSRLESPLGIRIEFNPASVRITAADIDQEWDREVSLSKRIRRELAPGAFSVKTLADTLHARTDSVRQTLNRMASAGIVVNLGQAADGSAKWGLKV